MIRPEVLAALHRWREVIAAALTGLAGLWLASQGGYVLTPAGVIIALLAAFWAVTARRRMRFHTDIAAPGVVEVVEGQISYMGPVIGGAVALPDLVDLRLVTLRGRRLWRLRQTDGQTILIPVDAAGADALFDAFVSLPGMDSAALVAALHPQGRAVGTALAVEPAPVLVWHRRAALGDRRP
jgi:hypothetical protein